MMSARVDLKVVQDRLGAVGEYLAQLRSLPSASLEEFLADDRNPAAAESLLFRSLGALFDTARHLLAKAYGQGSLEYREVARLSRQHGLIRSGEIGERFERMAGFRNRMTHFYRDVTPEELHRVLNEHLDDIETVALDLRGAAGRIVRSG